MKNRRLIMRTFILVLLVGALGFTLYSNFFTSKELVEIGDEAPNFILTDINGNNVQLSDYKGKGVFLNFWGTWCKPCEKEMPYMNNQYKVYKEQGVEILAVNVGETKLAVEKFVKKYDLQFPTLLDNDGQVLEAYGVNPLPTTFLINKDGKIIEKITASLSEKTIKSYMEKIKP
jgi:peroxiredoxin